MKLFTKCKNCKKEFSFTSSCGTRVELAMQKGENIILTCTECYVKDKYFVNDIYAKKSKLIETIAVFIFLVGTPLSVYIVYRFLNFSVRGERGVVLFLFPVIVYGILKEQDRRRVNTFNRSYL